MKDASETSDEVSENDVHENGQNNAVEQSPEKQKLKSWLNRFLKIKMTDGRILTGAFLCTDRDANIILGSCSEYLSECPNCSKLSDGHSEARILGLVMVPGRHIVSIHLAA